jgi:2-polyprenyl-3-methyl-5-hydroxy-6-metoxy-1,4-benzoquinol methylase
MKEGSKEWWTHKYDSTTDYLYGKEPSAFLVEHVDLLTKGETLDAGTGEGRNAVYLASKGFNVLAVDFAENAIARAKELAAGSGVRMEAKVQDLDFFLIPLMKYDTIVVTDFHPPLTLMKSLARGLKSGGTLMLEGYTMDQCRLKDGFKPEPFECFKANEALRDIHGLHLMIYNERRLTPKESRVQLIAKKLSM